MEGKLREILEKIDNYTDDAFLYAASFNPEADAYTAKSLSPQGQGLEHQTNYIEIARLDQIMDSRQSWHEGVEEFDPVWVSEFLLERKRFINLDPSRLNPKARPVGTGTVKKRVSIKPKNVNLAKIIGDGNASAGIDKAIEFYAQQHNLI